MEQQGPSAVAVWKDVTSPDGLAYRELAGRPDGTSYLMPGRHRVGRDRAGAPQLGLTLVLAAVPAGDTADLLPLVRQGVLGLTVGLAPLPEPAPGQRPLFARWARTTLLGPDDTVLATADSGGGTLAAALSVTLDRDGALDVWAALQDQDAPYAVSTEFGYRAVVGPVRTRLSGRWVDLWELARSDDFSRRYAGQPVTEQLPALLRQGLDAGLINADPAVPAADGLRPLTAAARSALYDGDHLGSRPSDWFTFDLTITVSDGDTEQTVTIRTPLRQALAGCWAEAGEDLVTLVAVDADTGRTVVPRRTSQRTERGPGSPAPLRLTEQNGAIRSVSAALALAPVDRIPIADQLDRVGRPSHTVGVHAATLDLVTDDAAPTADLPVLGDPADWTFSRRAGGALWYAPSFQLRRPAPTDTAESSPFVFSFARHGATADGQPGIDAEVVFTLDAVLGPEATAALGGQAGTPIPSEQLQVTLDLPFRDDSGATRRQRLPGTVEWDGATLVARVALLDHWAQLAYGALSQPGFQSEPARLQVGWTFQAWQRIDLDTTVVWGNKYAQIPIIVQPPPAEVSLLPRLRMRPDLPDGPDETWPRPLPGPRPVPVPRPVPRIRWLVTTVARVQTTDVLFGCSEVGACYVERRPEGPVPVGCMDALKLGQTSWRQYEEIVELRDPAYAVHRSLQQPGRFLIQPTRYCLGRNRPGDPRAYEPTLLLYSLLDPADPAGNQAVLTGTLQPAIEVPQWTRLRERLAHYAADPQLTVLTDVEGTDSYDWTLVLPDATISTVRVPGGVSLSVTTTLTSAVLLQSMLINSGLTGALRFTLPDGSTLASTLRLSLTEISGPADAGPLQVSVTGSQATLTNRVERPVAVHALRVDAGTATGFDLPVETELPPAQSCTVDLTRPDGSPPPTAERCEPDYTLGAAETADLTEIRSYVENITMNVIILDLIAHDQHQLARIDVNVQLPGWSPITPVIMSGTPASGEARFVLPLTSYQSQRVVSYQVIATLTDQTTVTGPWLSWDVAQRGAVIGLDWAAVVPTA